MGLPRAHHLLPPPLIGCEQKWLAKGLPTGVNTPKEGWQSYTYSWYHWTLLSDTIFWRNCQSCIVGSNKKTFKQM